MAPLHSDQRKPRVHMVLLPLEPGRKTRDIALVKHRGGGWWDAQCLGGGKRCTAGTCKHIADMVFKPGGRRVRPIPRERPI